MQEVERLGACQDLFTEKNLHHRRGEFLAVPAGVSFGVGQKVCVWLTLFDLQLTDFTLQAPGNLVHTLTMRRLIQHLLQSHSIKRIAGFQSSKVPSPVWALYLTNIPRLQVLLLCMLRSSTSILPKPCGSSSKNTPTLLTTFPTASCYNFEQYHVLLTVVVSCLAISYQSYLLLDVPTSKCDCLESFDRLVRR